MRNQNSGLASRGVIRGGANGRGRGRDQGRRIVNTVNVPGDVEQTPEVTQDPYEGDAFPEVPPFQEY